MPTFRIFVVNQNFDSETELEVPSLEDARDQAIEGALHIGVEEVAVENPFFAAEVRIQGAEDDTYLARYVVSVGVSPLR